MIGELFSAAIGCAFLWGMLQILRIFEGPEMAVAVGLGVLVRAFYAMWRLSQ